MKEHFITAHLEFFLVQSDLIQTDDFTKIVDKISNEFFQLKFIKKEFCPLYIKRWSFCQNFRKSYQASRQKPLFEIENANQIYFTHKN